MVSDPFGMPAFNPDMATPAELDQQIQKVDKELLDLQVRDSCSNPALVTLLMPLTLVKVSLS